MVLGDVARFAGIVNDVIQFVPDEFIFPFSNRRRTYATFNVKDDLVAAATRINSLCSRR